MLEGVPPEKPDVTQDEQSQYILVYTTFILFSQKKNVSAQKIKMSDDLSIGLIQYKIEDLEDSINKELSQSKHTMLFTEVTRQGKRGLSTSNYTGAHVFCEC